MRRNLWLSPEKLLSQDLPISGIAETEDLLPPLSQETKGGTASPLVVPEQPGREQEKPASNE